MDGEKSDIPGVTTDRAAEAVQAQPATHPVFAVCLVNDDYTPMDFVMEVLERFFSMSPIVATDVMLKVHHQGHAVCGWYSRDVAETKVIQVNEFSRRNQHPLLCRMEG